MKLSIGSGKKKPDNSRTATEQAGAPSGKVGIRRQMWILLAAATLLVAVPPLFVYLQTALELSASSQRQSELGATLVAQVYAQWIDQQSSAAELVTRDREIARLFASGTEDEREAEATRLSALFPGALRVRLLETGIDREDLDTSPPISYAALDMLRHAETRDTPPPLEVHMSGTPRQHINMVRRVLDPSGRRIVGHLMVSYPVQRLQDLMPVNGGDGYTQLRQVAAGQALALAGNGQSGLSTDAPDAEAKVAGSGWSVAYWAADSGSAGSPGLLYAALGAAGLAAVVLAALIVLVFRRMLGALEKDQATMLTVVKDLRDGRVRKDYSNEVVELHDTLELMARTASSAASKQASGGGERESAPAADQTATDKVEDGLRSDLLFDESALEITEADSGVARVSASIFRAYDIRGIVGESLTADVAYEIGRAIGSEAYFRGEQTIVVGRDGRLSGLELTEALIRGLKDTGRDVKDIGQVPTPVLYFAARYLDANSGVMVTGSHNPANYNGFKIVLGGQSLAQDDIQSLYRRIESGDLLTGDGTVDTADVLPDYIERIRSDVQVMRPVKMVIDCGNGVAGAVAPGLFNALGCEVSELFCEVDGHFPNHHPDPGKPENLAALIQAVQEQGAELGIAFDGDGDRLGVVTAEGNIVWPDRLMMLFAIDVLSRNPGAQIIYDVKSTRNLAATIVEHGGEALMSPTGHSIIKAKMAETGALLAGEMSGHVFFKERWFGFDDALYAAARLLEILANDTRSSRDVFDSLPDSITTPELNVDMAEGQPGVFMDRLLGSAHFDNANITTIDGMRVEFEDGWGLVRASNTTPCLVLRFEADNEIAMHRIQEEFRRVLLQADPDLALPF